MCVCVWVCACVIPDGVAAWTLGQLSDLKGPGGFVSNAT